MIIDFAPVQFMSSSMLGKLVKIHKKCGEYKTKLKLCGVTPNIREVFKITRLDKLFDFYSAYDYSWTNKDGAPFLQSVARVSTAGAPDTTFAAK